MAYFIWLYLANISNRFRVLASNIFRLSLIALVVEYLLLATHSQPAYYSQLIAIIKDTSLILLASFILVLLPSQKLILNLLALKKHDNFLRNSLFMRVLRLIKYSVKYGLLKRAPSRGVYRRLITKKRLKWIFIALYCYDLFSAYKKLFLDLGYLIFAYFSFACATWLYVRLSGAHIYYIHLIDSSFAWGLAIIGFLTFKILFLQIFRYWFKT